MAKQKFGGPWTETKLDALESYAQRYLTALKNQKNWFETIYIDGFAGSGKRYLNFKDGEGNTLFEDMLSEQFELGSALRVCSLEQKFDKYIFVEQSKGYVDELKETLADLELNPRIDVRRAEINTFLQDWCSTMNSKQRALLFLDPYGMQVKWETLKAVAATTWIDLCILIPVEGLNRALPRTGDVSGYRQTLDDFFGDPSWYDRIYEAPKLGGLFEQETDADLGSGSVTKTVNPRGLCDFMIERLKTIFPHYVSEKPIGLPNSRGQLLFILCFACGNKNGARVARPIADHICKKYGSIL
jgi:three-Cys-motif partner protein